MSDSKEVKRDLWSTRAGFILAAAGMAIGLGNVWRFPYITGKYGGALFLVLYFAVLFVLGIPLVFAELAIGRATRLNPIGAFKKLAPNSPWHLIGVGGIGALFLLMSYYMIVVGWTLAYMARQLFTFTPNIDAQAAAATFGGLVSNMGQMPIWMIISLVLTTVIVRLGISKGVEKFCKWAIPLLFVLLLVLDIYALTLPGSDKGLLFYLKPDTSHFSASAILAALSQVFYSLSLGAGGMIVYGSYMKADSSIPADGTIVSLLDTLASFMIGLCIFPAAFAFGMEPNAGPGLTFITLPIVFSKMPGGKIFGFLFFFMLYLALITSAIAAWAAILSYLEDRFGWKSKKTTWWLTLAIFAAGIPSLLGFGPLANVKIAGRSIMEAVDFLLANITLPLCELALVIFVGWVWGTDNAVAELNGGAKLVKTRTLWTIIIKYVAPILILVIFITGLAGVGG